MIAKFIETGGNACKRQNKPSLLELKKTTALFTLTLPFGATFSKERVLLTASEWTGRDGHGLLCTIHVPMKSKLCNLGHSWTVSATDSNAKREGDARGRQIMGLKYIKAAS